MDIAQAASELSRFCPPCFTLGQLSAVMHRAGQDRALRAALGHDERFLCVASTSPEEERFILKTALFRWFVDLNIRLANAETFRLTDRQVASIMSHLRRSGGWLVPPGELACWARTLGLIAPAYTPGQYVFPLARVLACSPPDLDLSWTCRDALAEFGEQQRWTLPLPDLVNNALAVGFARFSERVVHLVKARTGLLTGAETTLEELAASFRLTRERIRQLQAEFWSELERSGPSRRPFLAAFLADFMNRSGSLLVNADSPDAPLRKFLARCASVAYVELRPIGLTVLAASSRRLVAWKLREWFPDQIEADCIARWIESEGPVWLVDGDVRGLAERVAQFRRKRLKGTHRVYLTLRDMGRPAHYSRVAEVHNSLFPDHLMSERNVHATLGRERHGVVWIGVRGTFALAEWGYERPPRGLFEAATEIVRRIHAQTGEPVPMAVIVAELSKERRIVNRSSLVFATHFNPRLSRVFGDSFVPRDSADSQNDLSADELDRILRQFRDGH